MRQTLSKKLCLSVVNRDAELSSFLLTRLLCKVQSFKIRRALFLHRQAV